MKDYTNNFENTNCANTTQKKLLINVYFQSTNPSTKIIFHTLLHPIQFQKQKNLKKNKCTAEK